MSGVPMVTKAGQRTYTPAEPILGGQLVEGRAGARIGVAAAGSAKVLGVALTDATSPELVSTAATVVSGRQVLSAVILPVVVTVVSAGIEVPVLYSAAATFGEKLVATANGQVGPAGASPTPGTTVGKCSQPAGVAAGARGLMQTV